MKYYYRNVDILPQQDIFLHGVVKLDENAAISRWKLHVPGYFSRWHKLQQNYFRLRSKYESLIYAFSSDLLQFSLKQ